MDGRVWSNVDAERGCFGPLSRSLSVFTLPIMLVSNFCGETLISN